MENTLDLAIAEHLRDLHRAKGWSLDELAAYLTVDWANCHASKKAT